MTDEKPAPGPSLVQQLRGVPSRRPALALLAAVIAIAPPLLVQHEPKPPPAAPPRRAAAKLAATGATPILAALARHLPATDTLHLAMLDADGTLVLEIDTPDPQALRTALSADPALAHLSSVAETIVADAGLRVRLVRPGPAPTRGRPADATAPLETARRDGLLVEQPDRGIAVSGGEPAITAFLARLSRSGIGLMPWRMEAVGGAIRLSGMPVRSAAPAIPTPSRPLFASAPPPTVAGAPELVGIAGRLGRDAVALVRDPDGGVSAVAVGATVAGWKLDSLSPDAALFSRGGEQVRVAMPVGE